MHPVPFAAMYVAHVMERESCVVPLPSARLINNSLAFVTQGVLDHLSKISSSLQYVLSELHVLNPASIAILHTVTQRLSTHSSCP
jgi:hypothetical protein